ncbi:hypothetical protein ACFE04_014787 [Oxalis oulophora]
MPSIDLCQVDDCSSPATVIDNKTIHIFHYDVFENIVIHDSTQLLSFPITTQLTYHESVPATDLPPLVYEKTLRLLNLQQLILNGDLHSGARGGDHYPRVLKLCLYSKERGGIKMIRVFNVPLARFVWTTFKTAWKLLICLATICFMKTGPNLKLIPNFSFIPLRENLPIIIIEQMSLCIFLLWLSSIPFFVHSQPEPTGFLLNCGANNLTTIGNLKYIPDEGFIKVGNKSAINKPNLFPILTTVRYFPDKKSRKSCYTFPVVKGGKYLVRTTYFYGGFDGGTEPPVFDQIIQGTKWSIVNTTEDFAQGLSSYYEIVVAAAGKTLSVCIAWNSQTKSCPFISAVELESLADSVYNATDFGKYALSTIARSFFGNHDGEIISFPDDPFNRYWHSFTDENPSVSSHTSINPLDFWNQPPKNAFTKAINQSRNKTLSLKWPPFSLPTTKYYIALYFQDYRPQYPTSWRVFNVNVNGLNFYSDLNVTTGGVTVYSSQWPLSGQTEITLVPAIDSPVGPLINAGEVLQLVHLVGRTLTRDVMAMEDLLRSLNNPPSDWSGDPCLPQDNSWTGVMCSQDKLARVLVLNLTNAGLSGSLPASIGNLTGMTDIWFGGNKLTGNIPEMGHLKQLQTLHLEDNQLEGSIPESLGQLPKIREIFLQNNKLNDKIPLSLQNRNGLNLQVGSGSTKAAAQR